MAKTITAKTTKAELIEMVRELETKTQEKNEAKKTIADVQEEKRVMVVKETAKTMVASGILNDVTVARYNSTLEAIELAEKELKEILKTKDELISLETVKTAKSEVVEALEAEIAEKKEELNNLGKQIQAEYDEKTKSLKVAYELEKADLDKARKRELEEFNYNLKRDRQLEINAYSDKLAARNKELTDRLAEVQTREENVEVREEKIADLEHEISNIPNKIEEAVTAAVEEARKKSAASQAIEVNYVKRDAKLTEDRLNDKIEALVKENTAKENKISELEAKLEKAYASINDLATKVATKENNVTIKNETTK